MSVLAVEDDDEKYAVLANLLGRQEGVEIVAERAATLAEARQMLSQRAYDLLVLDIAMPPLPGRDAVSDGGVQLLEELESGRYLKMPTHIVGLTAFEEVFARTAPRFASRTVSLLPYDVKSDEWANALTARVWIIARTKMEQVAARPSFGVDVAIVCALHVPELRSVLRNGWSWELDKRTGDPTTYHKAMVSTNAGTKTVVAAAACQMGMTASAVLAMKMISAYQPRYVAMAGITAARADVANLGDVLVANPTWDWGAGKIFGDGASSAQHLSAPAQLTLRADVRERLQLMAGNHADLDRIRSSWPDPPATALRVHIGPVASGAAVVEDKGTMERIRLQHRHLLGVEMEGYAVHVAAEEAPEPQPVAFVMKSTVDFGVPPKTDAAQTYAAYTSAQTMKLFIERYLWD